MSSKFEKVLNLAKKTGDRLIVFDKNKEEAYVVMNLEEYEKIALEKTDLKNLTEDEMLDKINRDIVEWRSEQNEVESIQEFEENYINERDFPYSFKDEDINNEYFEKENSEEVSEFKQYLDEYAKGDEQKHSSPASDEAKDEKKWSIPEERKEAAEEVIEEDRQYLEEVTF